jgi:hypothetical protein
LQYLANSCKTFCLLILMSTADQLLQFCVHRRAGTITRHHPAADIIRELGRFGEIAGAAVVCQEGRVKRIAGTRRVNDWPIAGGIVLRMIVRQNKAAIAIELERNDRAIVAIAQLLCNRLRIALAS